MTSELEISSLTIRIKPWALKWHFLIRIFHFCFLHISFLSLYLLTRTLWIGLTSCLLDLGVQLYIHQWLLTNRTVFHQSYNKRLLHIGWFSLAHTKCVNDFRLVHWDKRLVRFNFNKVNLRYSAQMIFGQRKQTI